MDKINSEKSWFVYIAECRNRTLYTGITTDVSRRIKEHNTTNKCRYTRFRKPLKLIYEELCKDYSEARKREYEIKKFSRKKKLELSKEKNRLKTSLPLRGSKSAIFSKSFYRCA